MRKVLYVFSLLFFLSACHLQKEEAFVNPVFYGKMVSLSDLWDIKITPTTLDMDNRHGTTWHEDCEMWENEPKKVVLRCTHQLNKEQLEMQAICKPKNPKTEEHTTYVIEISTPKYINPNGGTFIVIHSYYEDETNPSFATRRGYLISAPDTGADISR